ncbi:MAG: hypothetical protein IJT00_00670 [Lachnospiraceae bacterium]|nr:hypothetical protein [Lachnospiraceae bacterium]
MGSGSGRKYSEGYLTVYLALTMGVLISFVLTFVNIARLSAVRLKADTAVDASGNGVLSEYNRELLKRYDLLFIETGYGTANHSEANTEERFRNYMRENYDLTFRDHLQGTMDFTGMTLESVTFSECAYAADNNCEVFKRQVADYMDGTLDGAVTVKLTENLNIMDSHRIRDTDVESKWKENQKYLDGVKPYEKVGEDGEVQKVYLKNPASTAFSKLGKPVLALAPPKFGISGKAADTSLCISHNGSRHTGAGLSPEERKESPECSRLLFIQYMLKKLGSYGENKDGSAMDYELEYVLNGLDSDEENLEAVCSVLFGWRFASNWLYIQQDEGKKSAAEAVALAVSIVTLCPELEEPLTQAILFAWSFMESVQDMKTLLAGGRVPIIKDSETWQTSVKSIAGNLTGAKSSNRGLKYRDYLGIMLLINDYDKSVMRTMDVMEMNIRLTPGNEHFRMDWCLDSFKALVNSISFAGRSIGITRRFGYY